MHLFATQVLNEDSVLRDDLIDPWEGDHVIYKHDELLSQFWVV